MSLRRAGSSENFFKKLTRWSELQLHRQMTCLPGTSVVHTINIVAASPTLVLASYGRPLRIHVFRTSQITITTVLRAALRRPLSRSRFHGSQSGSRVASWPPSRETRRRRENCSSSSEPIRSSSLVTEFLAGSQSGEFMQCFSRLQTTTAAHFPRYLTPKTIVTVDRRIVPGFVHRTCHGVFHDSCPTPLSSFW